MKDYALYRGDEIRMVGNIDEIATYLNWKRTDIHRIKTPYHLNKFGDGEDVWLVYEVEEDEE